MKGKDAPTVVNVGVWSAAVIGALAFAVTLGSYIVGGLNSEISADTEAQQAGEPTQECQAGSTMYTINNYPGTENLLDGGHATYYQDGDMNWRCSYVCVPDNTDLKTYLTSSKAYGQNLVLADNPTGFNDIFKDDPQAAMTRAVIISSSAKTYNASGEYARRCSGPNSTNYGAITDEAGETIDTLDRVESAYQEPTRDELISGAANEAGVAGQSEQAVAPVTSGGSDVPSELSVASNATQGCMTKLNNDLATLREVITKLGVTSVEVSKAENNYRELKRKINNNELSDSQSLQKCQQQLAYIQENRTGILMRDADVYSQLEEIDQMLKPNNQTNQQTNRWEAKEEHFSVRFDRPLVHETFLVVYLKFPKTRFVIAGQIKAGRGTEGSEIPISKKINQAITKYQDESIQAIVTAVSTGGLLYSNHFGITLVNTSAGEIPSGSGVKKTTTMAKYRDISKYNYDMQLSKKYLDEKKEILETHGLRYYSADSENYWLELDSQT